MHQEVPFGVFVGFGWAIIWIGAWFLFYSFNRLERMRIYQMIEKASAEGRTLPPEITARLTWRRGPRNWISDLRAGLIFLAVGVGLAVGGLINFYDYGRTHPGGGDLFHGPFALFPVPLMVGIAFIIMAVIRRRDERLD